MNVLAALGVERGVIAVAGAGGKTSLLFRLAAEARAARRSVLVTTTTHMGVPSGQGAVVYWADDDAAGQDEIRAALARDGRVVVLGRPVREDKVQGLAPERVDLLRGLADYTLVEADGARRRSFKLPADHEPVVPSSTACLVVVAGLDVLGKPLDEAHIHRLDRVVAATGQAAGSTVTEETLVRALRHPEGYLSRRPPAARAVVFLNKAEEERAAAGARIAARLCPPYAAALFGSAQAPEGGGQA